MSSQTIRFGVTGARGYLGSYLCRYLSEHDYQAVPITHSGQPGASARQLRLGEQVDADILKGIDILVHLAHDFTPLEWSEIYKVNVEGSRRLFEAAAKAGVGRLLFVSSMAAFDGCKSMYGKAKLLTENEALRHGGVAIRPGLIWGGGPGGMIDSLARIVASSRFVPMFGGGKQVLYLNHREDLSDFIIRFATGELQADGVFITACDRPWTFRDILCSLARAKGRKVSFVPVPWKPIYWLMRAMERSGRRPPFRSDSLLSLMNQDPNPDFSTYHRLGLSFRDFDPKESS